MCTIIQAACQVLLFFQLTRQSTQAVAPAGVSPLSVKENAPIVRTRVGTVRGRRARDGNYSMFLGIPYAKVDPANSFGPAIPHFFEEVFDAYDDSARCPQIEEFNNTITGTLDCLHLNIYVPNSASIEKPLPVMVYIFGGHYNIGFAGRYLYGPRFLLRHDVILVTLNYRLGPYGFMCINTPGLPGNQGLKDQVLALRWVKQNIHSFGGDQSRITLFGNSAGASSIDFHAYFLKERLYDRIILQSGFAISYGQFTKSNPDAPFKLAKQLNYTTNDINDALSYLSRVQPYELIAATNKSGVHFRPCIEQQFSNINTYITEHPINIYRVNNVDVLIGFNNDEIYTTCASPDRDTCKNLDFVSYSLHKAFEFRDERLYTEIKDIVRHFYYGDHEGSIQNMKLGMDAYSDFYMYHRTMKTAQKYLDSGVKNMYLYMFSYSGERNFAKHLRKATPGGGAAHADELGYLFDISYMKNLVRAEDMLIVDRMTELWTNFAKYGNPTPWPTELIPLRWPRVTQEKIPYLEIDTHMKVGSRPMHERMAFLDLLYKMIGQYQRLD